MTSTPTDTVTIETLNRIVGGEWKVGARGFDATLPLNVQQGLAFSEALTALGIHTSVQNGFGVPDGFSRFTIPFQQPLVGDMHEPLLESFARERGIALPSTQKAIGA